MKRFLLLFIILSLIVISFGCTKVPNKNDIVIIPSTEKLDVGNLTLLDEYKYNFDKDGIEESIAMYTAAQRDSNGEIAWDDGQRWVLVAQDDEKDYVLFDDWVQLGSINFYVFNELEEDVFYINTIQVGTANFTLKNYIYNSEKGQFEMTIPYNTTGNTNFIFRSNY